MRCFGHHVYSWVMPWLILCALGSLSRTYAAPETPHWTSPDAFVAPLRTGGDMGWPVVRTEARPGAYWWWPGSAVTREDLTWNLETYRKAGWGSMGVIGIYGVKGEEDRSLDIFSPAWFEMFNHAVTEAKRLGMNIDLTPSSGWRLGGPHITPLQGEQVFAVKAGRITAGPNGARVKRAGPGGQGLAVNPYSREAVAFHLDWLGRQFEAGHGLAPRAFYYDSFENPGNWCPEFLESFQRLRGYSLEAHADALAGQGDAHEVRRVLCDYRETLSDVLIECVTQVTHWAGQRGSGLRMQAHGAPANLLDMYAAAQIPETEVFGATQFDIPGYRRDPQWIPADQQSDLVNRFASSAAHVAGRNLIISESFTWLRNHYHTALSHIKAESDNLWLNGVNGIYYHGICYAPKDTAWPGWLFYAATQANARNSIFRDVPWLNAYMTRCQSVLQAGRPFNDILLYWPVYDLWMGGGNRELRFTVHRPDWIETTSCGDAARWIMDHGYTFDFISDQQLRHTRSHNRLLTTEGGNQYRTVLVPDVTYMTVDTVRHLLDLAEAGATILVWKGLPGDVPGWFENDLRSQQLGTLLARLSFGSDGAAVVGQGSVVIGDDLASLLNRAQIVRESMVDHGLQFVRRKDGSQVTYFVVNHSARPVDTWVRVGSRCVSAVLMDPMSGRTGVALQRGNPDQADVFLQLEPGETRVLRVFAETQVTGRPWPIQHPDGEPITVEGTWHVQFVEGGPTLPKGFSTDTLQCWTQLGDTEARRFAGSAQYSISVEVPDRPGHRWTLDLGDVRESARVWVNGKPAGVAVAHPFHVDVTEQIEPGENEICIEVTNLSANRVRDLDQRGVDWKKFQDINLVDHLYKPFDASVWDLTHSGLLGPVTLHSAALGAASSK
ncbi:MAG: glycoside hydrolase family 2 [Phycisphaerae bacterium]|nr:glycoside hydrolase family 2 [Phycisphaerae bacterium]